MRKFLIITIGLVIIIPSICRAGTTTLNLVDISGSLADVQDLFRKNMLVMNSNIERLDKNDRFIILAFRSHGQPWFVVDYEFPNKRGGRGRYIRKARQELRLSINHSFVQPSTDLSRMGGGTDIIGALNHSFLRLGDMEDTSKKIRIHCYSDGIQTTGVGSVLHLKDVKPYARRKMKMGEYLKSLERKLAKAHLAKPSRLDELVWFGAIYADDLMLTATDLGYLESLLRQLWVGFLERELPGTRVIYKLKY